MLRVLQSKKETRAFYNKISGVYDLLSKRSEAPMRKAGLELLNARAGENVLGIGFGTGHGLVALAKAVGPRGKVFGLDLSDKMLKLAKTNLAQAHVLERAQLHYADGNMDGVFTSFTLELFDTPEIPKVLRECKRVLRPGGRIVVVGMSKEAKRDPLIGIFEWIHKAFPRYSRLPPHLCTQGAGASGIQNQAGLEKAHVDSGGHCSRRESLILGTHLPRSSMNNPANRNSSNSEALPPAMVEVLKCRTCPKASQKRPLLRRRSNPRRAAGIDFLRKIVYSLSKLGP